MEVLTGSTAPRLHWRLLAVVAVVGWLVTPMRAQEVEPESRLKASFIYRLAAFVDWPERAFTGPASPLIIAIAGRDPFDGRFLQILGPRAVHGRAIAVSALGRPGPDVPLPPHHILFVPRSEAAEAPRLIECTRRSALPVLTISDSAGFADAGGMIALIQEGTRLRLAINRTAAESAGLKLRAQLLALSRLVIQDPATAIAGSAPHHVTPCPLMQSDR